MRRFIALFLMLMLAFPALADQSSYQIPLVGPLAFGGAGGVADKLNHGFLAAVGCSSGGVTPANGPSGAPIAYQCWANTSTTPTTIEVFDGSQWINTALVNVSTHNWTYILNDTSTVVGNLNSYYTTSSPAAIIGFFNRSFFGEATKNNTGNDSSGPFSWVEGLVPLVASSQVAVGNAVGQIAVSGYSRCSDNFTASGTHNANCLGLVGFGYQDDTASGSQFAQGATLIGVMKAGVLTGSAIGAQMDANSALASPPQVYPNNPTPNGATIAMLVTSGAYTALATQQVGAAMEIGVGRPSGPTFNAGLVIVTGTIASTSAGSLGSFPRAIEMPAGYGITWFSSGTTEPGGFFIDSSGNFTIGLLGGGTIKVNGNSGQTKTCGATIIVTAGLVTSC